VTQPVDCKKLAHDALAYIYSLIGNDNTVEMNEDVLSQALTRCLPDAPIDVDKVAEKMWSKATDELHPCYEALVFHNKPDLAAALRHLATWAVEQITALRQRVEEVEAERDRLYVECPKCGGDGAVFEGSTPEAQPEQCPYCCGRQFVPCRAALEPPSEVKKETIDESN
jgi:rubrerythrin